MENHHQMVLPFPSKSQHFPSTAMASSLLLDDFNGNSSNGFLNLRTETLLPSSCKDPSEGGDFVGNYERGEKSFGKIKGQKKIRKHRYAFQTRSQVDILDDGYRWRKYGQKAVKNNKFPRSYYRCTHQGCNVKKQVQRLTRDEGVVVTTYEGIHTHPIERATENFEHILSQMHIYKPF